MGARGERGQLGNTAEVAGPSLAVFLFGEMRLQLDGEVLPALESGRARSLLAYLLLHEGAQSRPRLAFLLWPDSTEGQARTNLRHLLHTLRRALQKLEPFLEVTPQTLRWRQERPSWVDVAAFEGALARAERSDADIEAAVSALREALGYYTGDLLAGCYDEWLAEPRARLRDRYAGALRRVADLLAARGERAEAVRFTRELLRTDPLQEDVYRTLMLLLDALGDRAGAVRVYHECAATLQRELGVEPSPATRRAYDTVIRSEHLGVGTDSSDADSHAARLRSAVLVGREADWRQLTDCWRAAEAGHAQLVVVSGEPGVGKTRLVEELQAWCAHRGAVVAPARSYAAEGELGFGVVIAWLRSAELAGQLRRAPPSDVAELARLLPELGGVADEVVVPLDAAEQRRRLFEAIGRTLAVSGRPLLLVADDAQWCDPASLQLIHYLVRLDLGIPLVVVATVRREELDDQHPLALLMSGLQVLDRSTEIALERLSRVGTEELARRLVGNAIDGSNADALYVETEGNPLFVVESIRAGWDGSRQTRVELSAKLQAVISARLGQLSEPAQHVVGMAATVGRSFTADLVGRAARLDDISLIRALDELWRRGVIREHDTDAYDFSHGKIRDVAYDTLSPATRRRHHLRVAEALQALHERDVDAVSGQVAANYDRAGLVDDAIGWYARAAVQAQRLDANVEAVRLLGRAWELVAALPAEGRLARELEILTALPTPLAWTDGFASERLDEVQRRAIEVAGRLGVEPEPPLLRSVVMSSLCRNDFDGARSVAGRLRDSAALGGDEGLLVESEYLLGICAFWGGDLIGAKGHFEWVVDRFGPDQRAAHVLRFGHDPGIVCLSRLANTLWFLGLPDDARRVRDDAIELAKKRAHPFSRSTALVFAALLAVDLGEDDRVREYAAALGDEGDQARPNQIKTMALAGFAEVLAGAVDDGIAHVGSAIEVCGPVNHAPGFRAALFRLLVAAHDAAGDPRGGLAAADRALADGGTRLWEAEVRRLRATFLAGLSRPADEVEAELGRALDVARRQRAVEQERRVEQTLSELRQPV